MASKFTSLTADMLGKALAPKLTGVTDNIRNLRTKFGLNSHSVVLTWVEWSGGRRGKGSATVLREVELLPVPEVVMDTSTQTEVKAVGSEEDGDIKLDGVSARYRMDTLQGYENGETSIPKHVEFYYRVTQFHPTGETKVRRYTLGGTPKFITAPPGWEVSLVRAHSDPEANGDSRE